MTFSQHELDDIWEGFQEAIDFTEETDRGVGGARGETVEWTGDIEYGDIRRYVDDFAEANEEDILSAIHIIGPDVGYGGFDYVGHDLWLTANGHGAGFWDRGLGDVGTRLTKAAKESGCACDAYIGDDGVMYLSGFEPPRTKESND